MKLLAFLIKLPFLIILVPFGAIISLFGAAQMNKQARLNAESKESTEQFIVEQLRRQGLTDDEIQNRFREVNRKKPQG